MSLTKEIKSDDPILRFSTLAQTDIKETWQYLSEQSEEAAERLIRTIVEKCTFLSQNPGIGYARGELIVNLRVFPFKKFNIFYFLIDNGIEIYRILHSSRDTIQIFEDIIDETK